MSIFKDYSNYYDLLYKDKDYKSEVAYIHQLIQTNHPGAKTILDLGCGTGKHAYELSKLGYEIAGADLSQQMIDIAIENYSGNESLSFVQGDIRSLQLNKKFDVVVSLFHVMCYNVTNNDLSAAFNTVKKHLNPNGVFIFDCWYGPGVLRDLPSIRTKTFENEFLKVYRESSPIIDFNNNIVNVHFNVTIENKITKENYTLDEVHSIRYLFRSDIDFLTVMNEMKMVSQFHWLTTESPSEKSWYSVFVIK